jgi:hypothetical protein
MKNRSVIGILLVVILFTSGCASASRYRISNESDLIVPLDQYKNIYVGWLDLDETKWKDYRYESIDKWKIAIHDMNVLGLQKSLKDKLHDKTITGDTSKSNTFPESGDLYIKSSIIAIKERDQWNGAFGGGFVKVISEITVLIQFYNINTKKELFNSTVTATEYGEQWGTFEAALDAIVYNMACYISDIFHK